MKEVGTAAVVLPAEPAVRHGEGNGYAGRRRC